MTPDRSSDKVVDLARYREARESARLPLFDGHDEGHDRPRPRLDVSAPVPISRIARTVEHRQRMLEHLGAMLSACRT